MTEKRTHIADVGTVGIPVIDQEPMFTLPDPDGNRLDVVERPAGR